MKLRVVVSRYVDFRKSLGEGFNTNENVLRSFCRALGNRIDVGEVRGDQVDAFLAGTGPVTRSWHVKHSALLGFYRYALTPGLCEKLSAADGHSQAATTLRSLKSLLQSALKYQKNRGAWSLLWFESCCCFSMGLVCVCESHSL